MLKLKSRLIQKNVFFFFCFLEICGINSYQIAKHLIYVVITFWPNGSIYHDFQINFNKIIPKVFHNFKVEEKAKESNRKRRTR